MTKPLVTFADPEALVIAYLKAQFVPRVETYKPATVTVDFPASVLTTATHLQVEIESSGDADRPILERGQIRVTAYAGPGKRTNVKLLASLAQGLLYRHPGDSSAAGIFPLIGRSDVIEDPTTKNLMVWFLARVDLKATQLAS